MGDVHTKCQSCQNLRRVNSDKTCSKLSNSGKDSAHPVVALVPRIWARGWLGCKHCAIAIVVQCCLPSMLLARHVATFVRLHRAQHYLWGGIGPNIGWPKDRAVAKGSADISCKVDQGWVKVPKQLQRSKVDPGFRPVPQLVLVTHDEDAPWERWREVASVSHPRLHVHPSNCPICSGFYQNVQFSASPPPTPPSSHSPRPNLSSSITPSSSILSA